MKTDPKQTGDSFRNSERQYHMMVEEVEDYAILMLDRNGFIQNWNKGAEKIKGYKEEEIVGSHFSRFYTPEDQAAGLPDKLVEKAVREGKAIHEGWRVRKDGTRFWGSIVITALHDESNVVVGFSKVTRDLTERKEAEDRLLHYARQLESQNKELQEFAYAAAHDMKEPLRKIQFYYSAIVDDSVHLPPEKQRSYLLRSADAAKRMQGLIDDLLAFTKVSEQVDRFESVDLNSIVSEAALFYQEVIEANRAVLASETLPMINGVSFQVRQLFLNLIGNSLKYRQPDRCLRVEISCERANSPDAEIRDWHLPRSFYKISVRDNGIGFEPEYTKKIFELFQRLHGRDQYAGTGIGLSICKKIMENHKGYIRASGNPGEGSVFELFFPVS